MRESFHFIRHAENFNSLRALIPKTQIIIDRLQESTLSWQMRKQDLRIPPPPFWTNEKLNILNVVDIDHTDCETLQNRYAKILWAGEFSRCSPISSITKLRTLFVKMQADLFIYQRNA